MKTALIIPDCHIPYHDKRAYNLMLKVAKDRTIDEVVILGDYADFYAINAHSKDANINHHLKKEIKEVNKKLDELDELFPNAKGVFIVGNHCYRLDRYINSKCPDLFGLVDVPSLLQLEERGWEVVPYGPHQKYNVLDSKLMARHEPLGGSTHCAHSTVVKSGCSVIFGHVHRIQESQVVMMNGDNHRGISCGWLGDQSHPVMQYVKGHHQWALGFALVHVFPNGNFHSQTIHIIDYTCMVGDKVYKG